MSKQNFSLKEVKSLAYFLYSSEIDNTKQTEREREIGTKREMGKGTEEFPDLGEQCSHEECNQLDFLPYKCDGCHKVYIRHEVQSNPIQSNPIQSTTNKTTTSSGLET